jgi:hypothetical protein
MDSPQRRGRYRTARNSSVRSGMSPGDTATGAWSEGRPLLLPFLAVDPSFSTRARTGSVTRIWSMRIPILWKQPAQ